MLILKRFFLLIRPYWNHPREWYSWLLLAGTVGATLGIVWVSVQYTNWSRAFYDALAEYFQHASPWQLGYQYAGYTLLFVLLVVSSNWCRKALIIHWRQKMTLRYETEWLRRHTHYHLGRANGPDNPDQRIAEDIRLLIEQSLELFLSLLKNVTGLFSFIFILWQLSGEQRFTFMGMDIVLHGYLVWIALIYAFISSFLAHRIGRPLHDLNGEKQRAEADYRASLLRIREHSEQVAIYHGERAELRRAHGFFSEIVSNWRRLMLREFKLESFITSYFRLSLMLPLFAVLPLYISRQITLGTIMQVRGAFSYVLDAFGWFIDSYRQLAAWSATVDRLWRFQQSMRNLPTAVNYARDGSLFFFQHFSPCNPTGAPLFNPVNQCLSPGNWLMISGASGIGKSSMQRGLAGLQKEITGTWQLPRGRQLFIPQKAYLPEDTLASVLSYPRVIAFSTPQLKQALQDVGLPYLIPALAEKKNWGDILSGGEQQRLSLARALLNQPALLCLDEATSNLDEESAGELLQVIKRALPEAIVIVISHQHTLLQYCDYHCKITPKTAPPPLSRAQGNA